jgi:hypothetical protein
MLIKALIILGFISLFGIMAVPATLYHHEYTIHMIQVTGREG